MVTLEDIQEFSEDQKTKSYFGLEENIYNRIEKEFGEVSEENIRKFWNFLLGSN